MLVNGFILLPYLGAIAVQAEFEERTEGQKSIPFHLDLNLERGSVEFSAVMPPPPKSPPPTAIGMLSSSSSEQDASRKSSFAESTEETQTTSTIATSARSSSNSLECVEPPTLETKTAHLEEDMSDINIKAGRAPEHSIFVA